MKGPTALFLVPLLAVITTSEGGFSNFTGSSLLRSPSAGGRFWKSLSSSYDGPRMVPTSTFQRSLMNLMDDLSGKRRKSARDVTGGGSISAEGKLDLDFHLDMRAFLEKIDRIPAIETIVLEINDKIDNVGATIIKEVDNSVLNLQNVVTTQLDIIIQKIQNVMDLSGDIKSILERGLIGISEKIEQVYESVKIIRIGDGAEECDLSAIEDDIKKLSEVILQLIKGLSDQDMTIIQEIASVANRIQQNYNSLQVIIEELRNTGQTTGICEGIDEIRVEEKEILSEITSVAKMINSIPDQVVVIMEQNGLVNLGGIVQQVIQICTQIEQDITILNESTKSLGGKLLEWHQAQSESIDIVKRTVVETTEIVKASTKKTEAVILASRRMKNCP